ncbi:MAG: hypothetical protein A2015_11065 [Spirochaetes bacterium GWF1_31_7]|nr:MAG: hypothetical protein A2Y30_02300 [Spirochaetes bacterium GWE1_32_154]OHD46364.1 MAG: hypothetical protein A2Y29_04160 [Spirochaetes bacterium GWE2_31_10]OHD47743.1 MAG: hypothetical protein A2015_11065 [Spirochaetes bacterium GWF1_31_7]HBD93556.1 hypothetical protein [Spirochaetia bacterium]HBI37496.1 hypothetical protein [Spirochaetia bacterium]
MRIFSGLLMTLMIMFVTPCFAQMTVGYTDFPPFTYMDEKGEIKGFFHEPVKLVLKEAGFDIQKDFKFAVEPSNRLYSNILTGKVAINIGIPSVPSLKDNILIGEYPFVNIVIKSYSIGDRPVVTEKGQFAGKSIIVIRGYSYAGLITFLNDPNNKCTLNETDSHESALKMLQGGRGDYLLDYSAPIDVVLDTIKIDGLKSTSLAIIPVFFIVSKAIPDAENLMKKINTAHQVLIEKGIVKAAN